MALHDRIKEVTAPLRKLANNYEETTPQKDNILHMASKIQLARKQSIQPKILGIVKVDRERLDGMFTDIKSTRDVLDGIAIDDFEAAIEIMENSQD